MKIHSGGTTDLCGASQTSKDRVWMIYYTNGPQGIRNLIKGNASVHSNED